MEVHYPDALPTGDTFDHEVLLAVDPKGDCGVLPTESGKDVTAKR